MKLLDAIVFVRTIVQDVPDQTRIAFEKLSNGPVHVPLGIAVAV